jgi:hypothetical protein
MSEYTRLVSELRNIWRALANLEELPKTPAGDVDTRASLERLAAINDLHSVLLALEESCSKD